MKIAAFAVAAFLIGSIPCSFLLARWVRGIDLRQVGSGNIGATNVARTLGIRWGLLAFLLDGLKGLGPVWAIQELLPPTDGIWTHLQVVVGLAAIAGHMYPPWLGFKGGKGVATAFGVVTALAPVASVYALAAFLGLLALTRIVSISSIIAVIVFAAAQFILYGASLWQGNTWTLGVFSVLAPVLILIRHRSNFARLLRGEEKQLTFRARSSDASISENKGNTDPAPANDSA